jgi:hypothetical protein
MAVFDWWLLIVGLVIGAGLVWLVLADSSRREAEILEDELPVEAAWIAAALADEGVPLDPATSERVLRLHRTYLESLPPDDPSASTAEDVILSHDGAPATSRQPAEPRARPGVPRDVLPARDR